MFNYRIKKGIINFILIVVMITLNSTSYFTYEMISGMQSQIKVINLFWRVVLGQTMICKKNI